MQIFVRMVTGRILTIECELSDTIGALKAKVGAEAALLVENFKLFFATQPLVDDDRTLSKLNIQKESMLTVLCRITTPQVTVKFRDGNEAKEVAIKLEENDTGKTLKKKIASKTNILVACYEMLFNNQFLDHDKKLSEQGIESKAIPDFTAVTLDFIPVIYIKTLTGKTLTFPYSPEKKLGKLKSEIEEAEKLEVAFQRLIFGGRQLENDNSSLEDLRIQPGTIVNLVRRLRIVPETVPETVPVPTHKTPPANGNTSSWDLIALLGTTIVCCFALPRLNTFLRPDTELPYVISIPCSLILGTLAGLCTRAYQNQQNKERTPDYDRPS